MFIYGKTASHAISVMSYLAARPGQRAGSSEIAEARSISQPLTAKLLTQLAAAGLVSGQPGPGGGYTLARPAETINLASIIRLFEQTELPALCPFGPDWCGHGAPCPLHDAIAEIVEKNKRFIDETNLAAFAPPVG